MEINSLYSQAVQSDKRAEIRLFENLTARFRLLVRRKVMNVHDGEEIVQEALAKIAEQYRTVEIHSSFAAWAHRVLETKVIDYYRKKKRRQDRIESLPEEFESAGSWAPDPEFRVRLLDCLRLVNRLNPRHARILDLRYRGFGIDEICSKLGLTRTNCYTLLSRARTALARCLKQGDKK